MNTLLIGIGIACVLGILLLTTRILRLADIIYGRKEETSTRQNNLIQGVGLFLFVLGGLGWLFWYGVTHWDAYVIPLASEHAGVVHNMFWVTMGLILGVLVITHVIFFYFTLIYRHSEKRRAYFWTENHRLEIFWTVVLTVALSVLVFNGWRAWSKIMAPAPEHAEVIEVVAYQFAWAARYGGSDRQLGAADYRLINAENRIGVDFSDPTAQDDFLPREIHLPKGRPVQLLIRGLDVIHSVYLPHFRVQMYATPGSTSSFWFTPTKTTEEIRQETNNPSFNYELACNKICGKGHFSMRYLVIVEEPEDYDKWYASQAPWVEKHPTYVAQVSNIPTLTQP